MTIANNAFLVRLSISQWNARKLDKTATRDAKERAGAGDKAGVKLYKTIIAADALDAIESIATAARIEHRKRTVPWQYDGPGAITAEGFPAYKAKMAELERDFRVAVESFLTLYARERADLLSNSNNEMRISLGKLFDPDDYPSMEMLRSKFAFIVSAEPMPQAQDFRVQGLAQADVEAIKADMGERFDNAVQDANKSAWGRVLEHVEKLKLRLEGYKPKGPGQDKVEGKFHDSVVENIKELSALLPSINIASDPNLTRMGQKLLSLSCYTGEDLRASESLRESIARQAGVILDEIKTAFHNMPQAA